jgi:hypothetical protein
LAVSPRYNERKKSGDEPDFFVAEKISSFSVYIRIFQADTYYAQSLSLKAGLF